MPERSILCDQPFAEEHLASMSKAYVVRP